MHEGRDDMDNLLEAYKDYSAMWQLYKEFAQRTPKDDKFYEDLANAQLYKEFAQRTPKDDKFYEDLANAPAQIKTTTTLGHLLKIVVLRAISEDDWH